MGVDYEAWAIEMCTLLDRIEATTGGVELAERVHDYTYDEAEFALLSDAAEEAIRALDATRNLCHQRFDIARKHGLTIEFSGQTGSGAKH